MSFSASPLFRPLTGSLSYYVEKQNILDEDGGGEGKAKVVIVNSSWLPARNVRIVFQRLGGKPFYDYDESCVVAEGQEKVVITIPALSANGTAEVTFGERVNDFSISFDLFGGRPTHAPDVLSVRTDWGEVEEDVEESRFTGEEMPV